MRIDDISAIGWVHSAACILALITGAFQLLCSKGTPSHRATGLTYVLSMVVLNLTTLFIFNFDMLPPSRFGPHVFGVFHYGAVFTLIIVLIGLYAAPRQQTAFFAYLHPICMIISYYLLLGGLVNEAFARVDLLRSAAAAFSPGARNFNQLRLVQFTQSSVMLFMLVLLIVFLVRVASYRGTLRPQQGGEK